VAGKNREIEGRLRARPSRSIVVGAVDPSPERGGYLLRVPSTCRAQRPAPLALLLHGATGHGRDALALLPDGLADAAGLILLAPTSREYTWDLLVGRRYGPDVAGIDRALEHTFSSYAVDPARVAVGGFSDGASYALSLGIANGDLFTHVLAFSPGFAAPPGRAGSPRIFVSHGIRDDVLPIDRCSRRVVPQLELAGYELRYREFEGGHEVPTEVAREAVDWFATG
jgi:phospholipase/carboxylesterase